MRETYRKRLIVETNKSWSSNSGHKSLRSIIISFFIKKKTKQKIKQKRNLGVRERVIVIFLFFFYSNNF